jgi:hypothetical protein
MVKANKTVAAMVLIKEDLQKERIKTDKERVIVWR